MDSVSGSPAGVPALKYTWPPGATAMPAGAMPRMRRGMAAGNAVMFSTTAPVAISASGSVAVASPGPEQKKP